VGHAGSSVIGEAFKQAWRNFVALVAACIRGLGIVIPLGVVVTAVWLSVKRFLLPVPRSAGR
jgi:biotin transporter BioY